MDGNGISSTSPKQGAHSGVIPTSSTRVTGRASGLISKGVDLRREVGRRGQGEHCQINQEMRMLPVGPPESLPAKIAHLLLTDLELVMSSGYSGGLDGQAGLGEAAVYEVAVVLDAP